MTLKALNPEAQHETQFSHSLFSTRKVRVGVFEGTLL